MRIPRALRVLAVLAVVCLIVLALEALGQTGAGAPAAGVQAAGGSIEGRVVLTATNQPLAGTDIRVINAQVPPLKTDQNGRFLFERLAAGRYSLMLNPMSGYRNRVEIIALRENQMVTGIEIKAYRRNLASEVLTHGGQIPVEDAILAQAQPSAYGEPNHRTGNTAARACARRSSAVTRGVPDSTASATYRPS